MTELVVCSGKGGTGKTSVVAGFAALAQDFVLADCDVDAANLHLVMAPEPEHRTPFMAGHLARIDPYACLSCGECHALCRFGAIEQIKAEGSVTYRVDPLACEGCGVCVHFCPADAIEFPIRRCGEWFESRTRSGPLVHANLDVGAENSGKLVSLVRERARAAAERLNLELVLIDGPPGIGCPVSAALTGADLTLLVTEPSLSSLHDLERVLDLAERFGVPALVCINKFDLSLELSRMIEAYCQQRNVPMIGHIPFDPLVSEAQNQGLNLVDAAPHGEASGAIKVLWNSIERYLADQPNAKG